MNRFEAALGSRHAVNRPRRDRLGNTLDFVKPKVAQTEPIAEEPACGGGEDDRPRLGQGLKAGRKARRIPNHSTLPQGTRATEVTDHHQAGGDANADGERLFRARLEPCNSGGDIEPRAHGSVGIVLVRAGIAEIGQYPIAPEISKETIIG
ncbi:MAG TPA: hypothetical protein VFJ59_08090 [Pseudolabrys sp.]|nr:hypothetical protein [Pseudolabrys sp.]